MDYGASRDRLQAHQEFQNQKTAMGLTGQAWTKNTRPMSSNQHKLGNKFVNRATSASMRKHIPASSYEVTGPVKTTDTYKDDGKINIFKPNGSGNVTEGTADTMHKTFDSERGKGTDMRLKPPRNDIPKVRPQTSNPSSANFYRHKGASKEVACRVEASANGVMSLSVDRSKV